MLGCSSKKAAVSTTKAAKIADVMANLSRKDLYKFITDWTGVSYRLGGLDKKGIDCSGFSYLLMKDIYGITLPRRSKDQALLVNQKSVSRLKEGDLLFFSFGGNEVDHVGVYLGDDFFVHASTTRGVVVDDFKQIAYQQAFIKAGSVK